MDRAQNFQKVAWFLDLLRSNRLNLDPKYQRRSVWTLEFKQYFIDTVLNNYPAPAVFVKETISNDTGIMKIEVVDGKQRLKTIFDFIENKFPIALKGKTSKQNFNTKVPKSYEGLYFKDLDTDMRSKIFNYSFSVENVKNELELREIFDRINRNGLHLSFQELRNSKYEGEFLEQMNSLTTYWLGDSDKKGKFPFGFPNISELKRLQMKDVEEITELYLSVELQKEPDFIPKKLDEEYEKRITGWKTQEHVLKSLRIFDEIMSLINDFLIEYPALVNSRIKNTGDFYSFFTAIKELKNERIVLDIGKSCQYIKRFLQDYDSKKNNIDIRDYTLSAKAAAKSKGNIQKRTDIMKKVLKGEYSDGGH